MEIIFIYTDSYPYGNGEQYIENELNFYSENFDRIIFVPIKITGKSRKIPKNAMVLNIHSMVSYSLWMKLFSIISVLKFYNIEKKIRRSLSGNFIMYLKSYFNALVYATAIKKWISKKRINPDKTVFYSFWFYHWALVISLLKIKLKKGKYISRAHLYDGYDFLKYNYWGGVKINSLDNIFCISNHLKNHFEKTYLIKKNQLKLSRLGVKSSKKNKLEKRQKKIIFVSCSSFRKDKRLTFIVDVLSKFKEEINWIHFGDGNLKRDIEERIKFLPSNITVELRGFVPNSEVLSFYQNYYIDLFINLSSREGIPVSLMEAISYGIPVIANDVFGNSELVNKVTGILVNQEDNAETVSNKIKLFLNESIDRKKIIDFQKKFFSAKKNYSDFKQYLISNE